MGWSLGVATSQWQPNFHGMPWFLDRQSSSCEPIADFVSILSLEVLKAFWWECYRAHHRSIPYVWTIPPGTIWRVPPPLLINLLMTDSNSTKINLTGYIGRGICLRQGIHTSIEVDTSTRFLNTRAPHTRSRDIWYRGQINLGMILAMNNQIPTLRNGTVRSRTKRCNATFQQTVQAQPEPKVK